jgi:hypothetical protein
LISCINATAACDRQASRRRATSVYFNPPPDRGENIQLGVFAFGLDQLGPAVHLHQCDHGSRLPESPQRHRLQDLLRSATGSPIRAPRLFKAGAHCQERGPAGRSTSASSHTRAAVSLWWALHQAPPPLVFTEAGAATALCGPSRSFDHKRRGPAPLVSTTAGTADAYAPCRSMS